MELQILDSTYRSHLSRNLTTLTKSNLFQSKQNKQKKKGSKTHLGCSFNKTGILIMLSFWYTLSLKRRKRSQAFRFRNVCMILDISPSAGFVLLADRREWLTRAYLFGNEIWSNIMVSFWRQARDAYTPRARHDCVCTRLKGSISFKHQGELCWNYLIRWIPGKAEL